MRRYIVSDGQDRYARNERIKAAKTKSAQIVSDIEQLFLDNDIYAEYVNSHMSGSTGEYPHLEVSYRIEGDWKHTHGFADELVQDNFDVFGIREEDVYSENDDDYYSSIHQYLIYLNPWNNNPRRRGS